MAVPARSGAADPEPAEDPPGERGETAVQSALITQAAACALAVRELAARPDDAAALEMARLSVRVLQALGAEARRRVLDEAFLAEVRRRAYEDGFAACRAARCRLQVIDGG
jgi:hypothetical protein